MERLEPHIDELTTFLGLYRPAGPHPVLWVGPGASVAAGYPSQEQIEAILRQRLSGTSATGTALVEAFIERLSPADFKLILQQEFGKPRSAVPLHTAIARLAGAGVFPWMITTNYDRLLEDALEDAGVPFVPQALEDNFSLQFLQEVHLVKLLGDLGDWESAVLASLDREGFEKSFPLLARQLDLCLRTRPVVFVGCLLDDPRLLSWLGGLSEKERRGLFASRAVLPEKEWASLPGEVRSLLAEANLKPILVPDFAGVESLLLEAARRLAPLDPKELTFEIEPGPVTWRVVGPTPESAPHEVPNPLADFAFLRLLAELGQKAGQRVYLNEPSAPVVEDSLLSLVGQVGERLTRVLLSDEARAAVLRRMNEADRGRARLAVRVRDAGPLGESALALPWELIAPEGAGRFAVRDGNLDLVREAVAERAPGLEPPAGPLTVAVAIAAPEGQAAVSYEAEAWRLGSALSRLGHRVAYADLGRVDDLVEAVIEQRAVAIHFSGQELAGRLVFEGEEGLADAVAVAEMAGRLRKRAGAFPRLFFLTSSRTGPAGPPGAPEPPPPPPPPPPGPEGFLALRPSTAAALHRNGFAQVVGYFGPVGDDLCARAEERFYAALARGETTLQAAAEARETLTDSLEVDGFQVRYPLAWTQLEVYHRGPDRPLALAEGARREPPRRSRRTVLVGGLPALAVGFTGRRALQHEVRRRFGEGRRLFVFHGPAGIGKTALALQLLSRTFASDPSDRLILRCHGLEGSGDPVSALRAQAEEHGRLHGLRDWDGRVRELREKIPDPVRGFCAVLELLLRERPRLAVYADGVDALLGRAPGSWTSEAEPWWREMERLGEEVPVLASTRRAWNGLDERAWVPVPPMIQAEMLRLVDSFDELGRLPRNVRVHLAGILQGIPRAVETLETLLAARRRTMELGADVGDPWTGLVQPVLPEMVRTLQADLRLEETWGTLPPQARVHLSALGSLREPAPRPVIEELGGGSPATAELIRLGWLVLDRDRTPPAVSPRRGDRWFLNGWVKAFAALRTDEEEKRRHGTAAGLAYWRWSQARAEKGGGVLWADLIEGIYLLHSAKQGDLAWPMVDFYVRSLLDWGHDRNARALLEACEAAGTTGERLARAFALLIKIRRIHGDRSGELIHLLKRGLDLAGTAEGVKADLQHEGGCLFQALGRYPDAERVLGQALAARETHAGAESFPVVETLRELGYTLTCLNRASEGERLLRRAEETARKAYGPQHPRYGEVLDTLGGTLSAQGRHGEAEPLLRRAVEILKVLGPDSASLRIAWTNLAATLCHLGQAPEAEPLLHAALESARRAQGPWGPDTAPILAWLALAQSAVGRPEAPSTARQALDTLNQNKTIGPDHPFTRNFAPFLQKILDMEGAASPQGRPAEGTARAGSSTLGGRP